MATEPPTAKVIGLEFVRRYYTILYENSAELSKFYGSESVFLHADDKDGSSNDAVVGAENIAKKIKSLELSNCRAKISQVDCQWTIGDCILIQVSGSLSTTAEKPFRTFVQSILLEEGSPKKYYARNDIFRYQQPNEPTRGGEEEMDNEEFEEQEEIESIKDTSENAPSETVVDQVNENEDNARNEDQLQNAEKSSPPVNKNDTGDEQKSKSVADENDQADEVPDVEQHDSADGKNESPKKDSGARTWAALASKSPHVPTDGETTRKKVARKPVENSGKSSRSNQHNKEENQSQRSNNLRNASQRDGQQTDHQIFIGGLTADVSEKELRNQFSVFGEVKHIKTNMSKGFGFVSFESEESVKKALSADNQIYVGKTHINIEEKKSSNVRHENRRSRDGGQRHSGFNRSNKAGGGGYRSGDRTSGRRQERN